MISPKTFKEVLASAKADGFKWVQFATCGKTYFITIDKLYLKLMTSDTYISLLVQQQWSYSAMIGAICHFSENKQEIGMSLHPFPVLPEIEDDWADYAG